MIERCCLPRSILIGRRRYSLAPPPVGTAISILHVLESLEDEQDFLLLVDLICDMEWTPSVGLQRPVLLGMLKTDPIQMVLTIHEWLGQGYEPKKIDEAIAKTKAPTKGKVNWSRLIEAYREVYGGSRYEVFNEVPYPFFLESMNNIVQDRASKNISEAVKHNPGKKAIKAWERDAQQVPTHAPVVNASDEEIKKSKELSKNKNKMGR